MEKISKEQALNLYKNMSEKNRQAVDAFAKKIYDLEFRNSLKKNPVSVLKDLGFDTEKIADKKIFILEQGETLPEGLDQAQIACIQLPAMEDKKIQKLSDEEFEDVAGGFGICATILIGTAVVAGAGVLAVGIATAGAVAYKAIDSNEKKIKAKYEAETEVAKS